MNLSTLFQIMGGVGLFLYGIKLMGEPQRQRHRVGRASEEVHPHSLTL